MSQLISQASAFNPGQDLWITPEATESRWMNRLDWYLNFQIAKARRHKSTETSAEMIGILNEIEWHPSVPPAEMKSPLLIPCEDLLPARWVALVPSASKLPDWIARIQRLSEGLGKPSMKIFLPTGLPAGQFTEQWKRISDNDNFVVVLD